jgi:hypothetical protein
MNYEIDGVIYKTRKEARAVSKNYKRIPQWDCDYSSVRRKPKSEEKRREGSMWSKFKKDMANKQTEVKRK